MGAGHASYELIIRERFIIPISQGFRLQEIATRRAGGTGVMSRCGGNGRDLIQRLQR